MKSVDKFKKYANGRTPSSVLSKFWTLTTITLVPKLCHIRILALEKPSTKIEKSKESLELICQWINEHLNDQIGWTELSRISGLSHIEINTLFHVYKKNSPMQWIRSQRELVKDITNIGSDEGAIQMPNFLIAAGKNPETKL